jgi:hypothetical protein
MAHALARARQGRYLVPSLATFSAHATVGPVLIAQRR